jgi:hypothetical protein
MSKNISSSIRTVNQIVSVGSVDGVCTAAAVLRLTGNPTTCDIVFAQAFTVDRIDPKSWTANRSVVLVDLAVNNREPAMTERFIDGIREAGHVLVAIIDEHSREDWFKVMGMVDHLAVEPQTQAAGPDAPKSSGAVLMRALESAGEEFDSQTRELMEAADAGDRMDFTTRFGGFVNKAMKANIQDDARRVYLARHFAVNTEADSTIQKWVAEYEQIEANHDKVVASKKDLGDGLHRIVATGLRVDMTSLMSRLYREGAKVVVLEGEGFNKALGKKVPQVSFGSKDQNFDLLTPVKAVVATASGFTSKVNVDPADEEAAIAAVRAALRK